MFNDLDENCLFLAFLSNLYEFFCFGNCQHFRDTSVTTEYLPPLDRAAGPAAELPGFAEVGEVHLCQQVPLDAPVVAVLEEDPLFSAVGLVASSALSAYLDVKLDKVHPGRVQIPAHQLSLPGLSKRQKNLGQLSGSSLAFYSLVSSPLEHPAL